MLKVIAAVAPSRKYGIGHLGELPWPFLEEDMKQFRAMTVRNTVVMGYETWLSLGERALPNRENLVLSRSPRRLKNATQVNASDVMDLSKDKDVFIIGGQQVYELFIHRADEMYLTHVFGDFKCDRYFPFPKKGWVAYWISRLFEAKDVNYFMAHYKRDIVQ